MSLHRKWSFDVFVNLSPHFFIHPSFLSSLWKLRVQGRCHSKRVLDADGPYLTSQLLWNKFFHKVCWFLFESRHFLFYCAISIVNCIPLINQNFILSFKFILALITILSRPWLKQPTNIFYWIFRNGCFSRFFAWVFMMQVKSCSLDMKLHTSHSVDLIANSTLAADSFC